MLFETRLRRLEARYRARLSAAGESQLRDPGITGASSTTAHAIERANAQSKALEQSMREQVEPTKPGRKAAGPVQGPDRLEDLDDAASA